MLARARLYRRYGRRFSQSATVEVLRRPADASWHRPLQGWSRRLLRRLGAKRAVIEAAVRTAPLPEVVAARERRAAQAEQAAETAAVVRAIGERIALRLEEETTRPAPPRRARQQAAHPDQLVLAL